MNSDDRNNWVTSNRKKNVQNIQYGVDINDREAVLKEYNRMKKKHNIVGVILAIFALLISFYFFDFYMVNNYTYFDTTIQKLDVQTVSYSSDAQTMEIQMTIQYKIDATKAENILTEYTNNSFLSLNLPAAINEGVSIHADDSI